MEKATQALLQADLGLAEQVIGEHEKITELSGHRRGAGFRAARAAGPRWPGSRSVVSGIQIVSDIDRMGALALHVAKITRRRHPNHVLPEEVNGYFAEMGRIAVALGAGAKEVLATRDPERAAKMHEEDDAMDDSTATCSACSWTVNGSTVSLPPST